MTAPPRPCKRTPERRALFRTLATQRPLLTWAEILGPVNELPGDPMTPLDLAVWRYDLPGIPKRDQNSGPPTRKRSRARCEVLLSRWGRGVTFGDILAQLNELPGGRLERLDLHLWRSSLGLPRIDRAGLPVGTHGSGRPALAVEAEPPPPPLPIVGWVEAPPGEILDWARRTRVLRPAGVPDGAYLKLINQQRAAFGLPRFRPLLTREAQAHAA